MKAILSFFLPFFKKAFLFFVALFKESVCFIFIFEPFFKEAFLFILIFVPFF